MTDLSQLEQQYGLPAGLLTAQMNTESGGNPNAVSPKGALGLFQFLPDTAKQYGIDPLNPDQASTGAARMDSDLLKKYGGDLPSALAAYNWGQGNLDRNGLNNAPSETQNYISKIMGSIGNAIVPSANAAEMPDLSKLSDDELQKIASGGKPPSALSQISSGVQSASLSPMGGDTPDLSNLTDDQLEKIASGKVNNLPSDMAANGQSPSPQGAGNQLDVNGIKQNSPLQELYKYVAEKPDENYIGLIPAAKAIGRGALGMMADIAGEGQPVGSNLNPDELNALTAISPVSRMALPKVVTSGQPIGNKVLSFAGDAANALAKDDRSVAPKIPPASSGDLAALANQSYAVADKSGAQLKPEFTDNFLKEAESVAPQTEAGKAISGDNAVTQLVDRMQSLKGKPISLQGAQEIDEALGGLVDKEFGMKGLSKEGKQIYDLQSKFRSMMNDAVNNGHVTGDDGGFQAWKQGQQYWSQMMAMKDVERIMQRADMTDNPATSVRTQMKNLYNNPARMRGFTSPAEKAAIKSAAQTGAITGLLKIFGSRLIPIAAATAEGIGGGGITGGAIAGTVTHGLSSIARNAASKIQANKAQKVINAISKRPPKGAK